VSVENECITFARSIVKATDLTYWVPLLRSGSQSPSLLATRIITSMMQTFRYRLISAVGKFVKDKLEQILVDPIRCLEPWHLCLPLRLVLPLYLYRRLWQYYDERYISERPLVAHGRLRPFMFCGLRISNTPPTQNKPSGEPPHWPSRLSLS